MALEPDFVYTTKEASEVTGIYTRKLTRLGKKHNVQMIDNTYVFTGAFLMKYLQDEEARTKKTSVLKVSQDKKTKEHHLEVERLRAKNENLQQSLNQVNERLRSSDEVILQLKNELEKYKIAPNERIEVFTNEEYSILEQRLREWHEQQQKLKHQEELFNVEKLSLKDMLKHYKNQWKYQKKQSEKILKMHQTLIDTIDKQNKLAIQRQSIEAVEKDVVDKNWQPKK